VLDDEDGLPGGPEPVEDVEHGVAGTSGDHDGKRFWPQASTGALGRVDCFHVVQAAPRTGSLFGVAIVGSACRRALLRVPSSGRCTFAASRTGVTVTTGRSSVNRSSPGRGVSASCAGGRI
jgi:hypothetical protein